MTESRSERTVIARAATGTGQVVTVVVAIGSRHESAVSRI
jgi:hypothetical protein